ncbi:MAG: acyclic terpene utilization AtuA family protein [Thermaerobacterales bacterium]
MKKVFLGGGSAYWGDMLEPAVELAAKGNVQYIGFDHLAELTMSIMQRIRAKDPTKGYIPDIVPWMKAILPEAYPRGIKLITNAGGVNPEAAAAAVMDLAASMGFKGLRVGIVTGDDLLGSLDDLEARGVSLRNMDTGEEGLGAVRDRLVAANAYIGADGIVHALEEGADVVITGRVSDTALFVGPLMHEFGWRFEDGYWNLLGAAVTVGHAIECAEMVCGGVTNRWHDLPRPWAVGFPIAEVSENGEAVITKVPGSGGVINEWTVKEQLTYEIGDPANYIMPDAVADFTTLRLEDQGSDRVRMYDMSGRRRPDTLKAQIGYDDGWVGEAHILMPWPDALEQARRAEEFVRRRFEILGIKPLELRFDYIGVNTLHGPMAPEPQADLNEVGLRIAARTRTREEADAVRREGTHLWTLGGVGASFGVPFRPRRVVSLWPALVPRDAVKIKTQVREVQ